MRSLLAAVVVAILLAGSASFGATVTFVSPVGMGHQPVVNVQVYITGSEKFGAVDMILQSDTLDLEDSQWAPAFPWDAGVDNGNIGLTGAPHERWVGGAMTSVTRYIGPSLLLGTLTIPTFMLPDGIYPLWVDGNSDGISAVGYLNGADPLVGYGQVVLIPEPATMALFAAGCLFVARRRPT